MTCKAPSNLFVRDDTTIHRYAKLPDTMRPNNKTSITQYATLNRNACEMYTNIYHATKYSRINQINFVEDNLYKN